MKTFGYQIRPRLFQLYRNMCTLKEIAIEGIGKRAQIE